MMRALAHHSLSLGQPLHCADLIEAALTRAAGRLDGPTEALLHITHARAHAVTGNRAAAARVLLVAEDALGREDRPQASFSLASGPAAGTVASHTARTLTELGDHRATEREHRAALTRWDPAKYQRVHLLTYADIGDSLAAQARADEAVATWARALDLAQGVASGRTRTAFASIRVRLAVCRRRGVPGARDLDLRIRQFLP